MGNGAFSFTNLCARRSGQMGEAMKNKIPGLEKAAYTGGLLGQNMLYNFMSMYILFFFTDLLAIPVHAATTIIVIGSLWDAINDPIMGLVVDRTRSRWGKFRPYMIFGPLMIALTSVLCFVHYGVSPAATIALAAISYVLWDMSYTVCDIPIWAITSSVSHNPDERNMMVTLGKIGGTIGTVIVTVGSIQIINAFGGERSAGAYTKAVMLIAVIGAVLMVAAGIKTKERIQPDKEVILIRKNLKTITVNGPLLALMAALLISNLVNGIRQSVQMYFVVYVWKDAGYVTPIGLSLVIGMTLGMIIAPKLIKHFEKKKLFFLFCLLGGLTSVIPFLGGRENVTLGLIFLGLSFVCTGAITILCSTMLLDAVEFSEWKLGYRGEGIIFSVNTFLTKLSSAFARLFIGIGLSIMSYVENQPITPKIQTGFSAMMYLIPAASFLLAVVPMFFYRLSGARMKEIHEKLEQCRGNEKMKGE